jgi:hypothetical protein
MKVIHAFGASVGAMAVDACVSAQTPAKQDHTGSLAAGSA